MTEAQLKIDDVSVEVTTLQKLLTDMEGMSGNSEAVFFVVKFEEHLYINLHHTFIASSFSDHVSSDAADFLSEILNLGKLERKLKHLEEERDALKEQVSELALVKGSDHFTFFISHLRMWVKCIHGLIFFFCIACANR